MTDQRALLPGTKSLLILGLIALIIAAIALTVGALLPADPHPLATIRR